MLSLSIKRAGTQRRGHRYRWAYAVHMSQTRWVKRSEKKAWKKPAQNELEATPLSPTHRRRVKTVSDLFTSQVNGRTVLSAARRSDNR